MNGRRKGGGARGWREEWQFYTKKLNDVKGLELRAQFPDFFLYVQLFTEIWKQSNQI